MMKATMNLPFAAGVLVGFSLTVGFVILWAADYLGKILDGE